jgi:hypothetical protein
MPQPKATPPDIEYEQSPELDESSLAEAFNFLFDKYFNIQGQSP